METPKSYTRQAITGVSILIILIASLSYFALQHIKASTLTSVQASLQTILETVDETHHLLVEQRLSAIESIAKSTALVSLTEQLLIEYDHQKILRESESLHQLRDFMTPLLSKHNDQGFFIIAPDKISIGSMRNSNIGFTNLVAQHQPELFARSLNGETVFVPPMKSDVPLTNKEVPAFKQQTMFVMTPISNEKGDVVAVLTLRINPQVYFDKITTLGQVGHSGETYAFDEHGTMLTNSRFIEQLTRLNNRNFNLKGQISLRDPGGNLTTGYVPIKPYEELPLTYMAQQALHGINSSNMEGYRDYRGVDVFGAWIWNHEYHFGIATEIDVTEALVAYEKTKKTFITVVSLIVLLSILILRTVQRVQYQNEKRILAINEELESRVEKRTEDLHKAKESLSKLNSELSILATTDSLTGLHNRRYFDAQFIKEWQRCKRDNKKVAALIFDIDFFKQFNDLYGHLIGDSCLQKVGEFLTDSPFSKRPGDIVARYGGEEFVVLLSDPTEAYCEAVANAICEGVEALNIPHEGSGLSHLKCVTVSLGYVITSPYQCKRRNQVLAQADEALYKAKRLGKNRAIRFYDTTETPALPINHNVTTLRSKSKVLLS